MRLTQYTDFSLRVLIYLGLHPERRCTIQEIAEGYGISRNHLMKVVQQLAGAGFVESTRGSGGGLRLAGAPESINLGRVVREMEPDFGMVECMRPGKQCVIEPVCTLPGILNEATAAYLEVVGKYSLADLLPAGQLNKLKLLLKSA
ncbi:MAG: Rrf2 family transcriptional regulator [Wenzhouxiangellaceae bacterium]|nr:Rrf2 family transcriptional regulator [Wenzhouxiangellaceae bacterium]